MCQRTRALENPAVDHIYGKIKEIQESDNGSDLRFRVEIDTQEPYEPRHHHESVQKAKTIDEMVEFLISDKDTEVVIKHNNDTGKWLYSIWVKDSDDFWLCSFDTESEAVAYVKEHNLRRCDLPEM